MSKRERERERERERLRERQRRRECEKERKRFDSDCSYTCPSMVPISMTWKVKTVSVAEFDSCFHFQTLQMKRCSVMPASDCIILHYEIDRSSAESQKGNELRPSGSQ